MNRNVFECFQQIQINILITAEICNNKIKRLSHKALTKQKICSLKKKW